MLLVLPMGQQAADQLGAGKAAFERARPTFLETALLAEVENSWKSTRMHCIWQI